MGEIRASRREALELATDLSQRASALYRGVGFRTTSTDTWYAGPVEGLSTGALPPTM